MKKSIIKLVLVTILVNTLHLHAQRETTYLFQNFVQDALTAESTYGEALMQFNDFSGFSRFDLGVRGAFPVSASFEVGGTAGILIGEGKTSMSDIMLMAKKYLTSSGQTLLSAGGFLTLPTGSEKHGHELVNLAFFGALRHSASDKTVITGTASLNFLALNKTGKSSLGLGGGIIQSIKSNLSFIAELTLQTRAYSGSFGGSNGLISGGVDYMLNSGARLRAMMGFGIDDGAPDFKLHGGYLHFF